MDNLILKKICALALALFTSLCGCTGETPAYTTGSYVVNNVAEMQEDMLEAAEEKDGFYVSGTKLYDANGSEFIMRGVNHAHTWFKDKLEVSLDAIASTGANTVRIVLSNGVQWEKDSREGIENIIEQCKSRKLVTILEVHDATGYNDSESLDKIADYWVEMKDALIGSEKYVILNIANEWYGDWGSSDWASAYCSAIPKIREAGIKNLIMVDSAGWGQYGKSVAEKGREVFDSDPLGNTMFSIHMYGSAGGSKSSIKSNIDGVLEKDLCLCIGEFGYNHSDGDVDEAYIMEYCKEQGVGWLGWSWKGNGGGVEYLDIAKEWDGSVLSEDWGEPLINGENGIKETSQICSVFE